MVKTKNKFSPNWSRKRCKESWQVVPSSLRYWRLPNAWSRKTEHLQWLTDSCNSTSRRWTSCHIWQCNKGSRTWKSAHSSPRSADPLGFKGRWGCRWSRRLTTTSNRHQSMSLSPSKSLIRGKEWSKEEHQLHHLGSSQNPDLQSKRWPRRR